MLKASSCSFFPSKHNTICALTLETVVPFDKMQISWAVFIKECTPSPFPPAFTYCHSGPSQLGAERSPSSLCRHGPCCSGPQQPVDTEDAPTQRKCGGKLDFFHNTLRLCEAATL